MHTHPQSRHSYTHNAKKIIFTWIAFCFALFSPPARAATITVPIEANDQDLFSDNTAAYVSGPLGRVGSGYVGKPQSVSVLPFKLPALPPGERIISATLRANLEFWSDWGASLKNIDIYGIGVTRDSSGANYPANFVNGVTPASNASAFLLQDNWITPADITGNSGSGKTIPKVSQDFGWFVQALYDNGALAGKYGFLSLAHDATLTSQRFYGITSADGTSFPKPVITIVTGTIDRNYYLNGDTGSDAGSGSALSPWKTFNRAQSALQPGDTVYCTGTFGIVKMITTTGPAGELPYKVGTAAKPISYKAWGGKSQPHITRLAFDGVQKNTYLSFEGFRFDRGEVETPGSLENSTIYLAGAWHITFTNCDVAGAQAKIPASILQNVVSFAPYTPDPGPVISGGNPGNASYVTIQNCRIKDGGCGISINENPAYTTKQCRFWTVLNNDIYNTPEDGIQVGGGDAGAGSIVRGNHIHDQNLYTAPLVTYGFAYDASGPNPAAFNNLQWAKVIQDVTGKVGIFFYSSQPEANGWARFYVFALNKNDPPSYFAPYGWRLESNPAVHIKSLDRDGVTVVSGDCCHTDCISIMAMMTGALFEKNRAHAVKIGGALKIQNIPRYGVSQPPTNITFQNNLFYSTTYNAASGFLINVAGGKNVRFLHNTIFGGPAVRFVDVYATGYEDVYFYNNIIGGGAPSNRNEVNLATSDYNVWLTAPTGAIQRGPHDVVLPPKLTPAQQALYVGFVDAAAGDLRIQSGSGAQNIGALNSPSFPFPLDDINGFPRGTAAPDLPDAGAFEIGSPTP
jgi:hypothetical protein